jgi:hypothetical protein
MPLESVKQRVNALSAPGDRQELTALLSAVVDALQAVAVKLDADAGVTDTNYAATVAAIVID